MSQALHGQIDGVELRVKVVPGASRTKIAGMLGDRLKIAVAAPPEAGKANRALCGHLAEVLRVALRDVEVVEGHTQPRKTVFISGATLCAVIERLRQT